MEDLALVRDLGIVWLAALVAGLACVKLKQPTILGYILAGLVIGPHGLKLIEQEEQVKTLAEMGVALLLFALGVEVTLKAMNHMRCRLANTLAHDLAALMPIGQARSKNRSEWRALAQGFESLGIKPLAP